NRSYFDDGRNRWHGGGTGCRVHQTTRDQASRRIRRWPDGAARQAHGPCRRYHLGWHGDGEREDRRLASGRHRRGRQSRRPGPFGATSHQGEEVNRHGAGFALIPQPLFERIGNGEESCYGQEGCEEEGEKSRPEEKEEVGREYGRRVSPV